MLRIFTDGSVTRPNEGRSPGGWSFYFELNGRAVQKFGSQLEVTNNQMELTGPIKAMEYLLRKDIKGIELHIISDSQYVINGASQHLPTWKRQHKFHPKSNALKNKELWMRIDNLSNQFKTRWSWVRGHNGHRENEICDVLAKCGSRRALGIEDIRNSPEII